MNPITADCRLAHILHKGDTIRSGDHLYTITGDPIGFGGSSVLYPAGRNNSDLLYAIKEYFPRSPAGAFVREGGVIRPVESGDAVMPVEHRKRMEAECTLGQRIRVTGTRAIGIWDLLSPSAVTVDGRTHTQVADGIFAVLERMDTKGLTFARLLKEIALPQASAHPIRTGGLPKVYTTACMIEQVLQALQQVHEAGYLFGDIQDGNVFFSDCRLDEGDIGIGNLLDFGCARALTDSGRTAPIDESCFTTEGFIPPELLDPEKNNGSLTLGPEADLYAVGCLMLRCLVSGFKIAALGDSPVVGSNAVDGQDARKLGCPERIRKSLNAILSRAMALEPEARYPSAAAMLADIRTLKRDTRPPEYLLPPVPGASESFVSHSRDREIARLRRELDREEPLFIWGLGGIGKTETAIQLARTWDSPKGAYFTRYILSHDENWESMKETVLRMPFTDYRFSPKQKGLNQEQLRELEYRERMDILRKEYGGALLIIDNFDHPEKALDELRSESGFREITNLGITIVFTTRYPVDWAPQWEIRELAGDDLLQLMRRYCVDPSVSDWELEPLIEAVDGHTLTVELMAKTMARSRRKISPAQMLEHLRSSSLSRLDAPEVRSDQNREVRMAGIHDHLRKLFDLSGLDADAGKVLCCATLIPENGMDCAMFETHLEDGLQDSLTLVLDCGWLKNSADNMLTIHPVIRDVCREELKPDDEKCLAFLENLLQQYDEEDPSAPINLLLAACFGAAADTIADDQAYYAYKAGLIYEKAHYYQSAFPWYEKTLSIRKSVLPEDDPELAKIYRALADVCFTLIFSAEYQLSLLKEEHPELFDQNDHSAENASFGDLVHKALLQARARENITKAIQYYEEAVFMQYESLDTYCAEVYHCADRLAYLYHHRQQDYQKAAVFARVALDCQKKIQPPDFRALAHCHEMLGLACGELGRYKEGQKHLKQALRIRKRALPPHDQDIAETYVSLAIFYDHTNKRKADQYLRKWSDCLNEEHSPGKSIWHRLFRKGR